MSAQHHSPGIRAHLRKFGISHDDSRKLRRVLETLEAFEEPLRTALMERGHPTEGHAAICDALRAMVGVS